MTATPRLADPPPSASPSWQVAAAVICAAILLVYGTALTAEFISWDDPVNVTSNKVLHQPWYVALAYFWTRPFADLYVPVTYTSWLIESRLTELAFGVAADEIAQRPVLFHGANLVWHALASCGVWQLLRYLVHHRLAALVGALCFALHPLHVESVAWVTEAKGLLSAAFAVWAIVLWLPAEVRTEPANRCQHRPGWALASYVLSLLAKPSAVVVPLIALAIDRFLAVRPARRSLASVAPWLLAAALCSLITQQIQTTLVTELPKLGFGERAQVAATALRFYVVKTVAPAGLSPDYGATPQQVLATASALDFAVPVAVTCAAFLLPGRKRWLAAWLIFVAALLPVLGLVPFNYQQFSTTADRYAYLALIAPAWMVAAVCARLPRRWLATIGVLLLVTLSVLSFRQTLLWHDDRALFQHAYELNPRSWVACNALGHAAVRRGEWSEAERWYREAAAIQPAAAGAYVNLGRICELQGHTDEAVAYYRKALVLRPDYPKAIEALQRLGQVRSGP
ncbi:MAG: tetratricopeptide repeat protein [Pirellulales bacterium]|nr:tetratricopeptide repeat protein [Pirellulales bacterium]